MRERPERDAPDTPRLARTDSMYVRSRNLCNEIGLLKRPGLVEQWSSRVTAVSL